MAKLTEKQRLELEKRYNQYITDKAGLLHNQIAAFISGSKVPLLHVLLVLELLLEETKRRLYDEYLGK